MPLYWLTGYKQLHETFYFFYLMVFILFCFLLFFPLYFLFESLYGIHLVNTFEIFVVSYATKAIGYFAFWLTKKGEEVEEEGKAVLLFVSLQHFLFNFDQ